MKRVHTKEMVAHLWANKSQDEARTPTGNFYFTGDTLYSYGSHYVVARHVMLADGPAILFNGESSTSTTNKHRYAAQHAIHGRELRVDGMDGNTFSPSRHGAWMLKLAQSVTKQAGASYGAALGVSRISMKRDGFIATAEDRVNVARTLAQTVATATGDAAGIDAASRRSARSLVKLLESLAPVPRYPQGEVSAKQRKAHNAAELDACRANMRALDRDHGRQRVAELRAAVDRSIKDARYNVECGNAGTALDYAQQAERQATDARRIATEYGLRLAKLPDVAALVAELKPAAVAEKRERIEREARKDLTKAERMQRRPNREAWLITRACEDVQAGANNADELGCSDAVPQWMRDRIAVIHRRMKRADRIEDFTTEPAAIIAERGAGDEHAQAGKPREAVRNYTRALNRLSALLAGDGLPRRHPAWAPLGGFAIGAIGANALREHIAKQQALFAAEDAEKVAAWRACNAPQSSLSHDIGPLLRVRGDAIETSHGATVPLSVAPLLWRLCTGARSRGEPIEFTDERAPRIGSFRLDTVNADGSIKVGCHRIAWPELEHVAERLGYTQAATMGA